MTNEEYCIIKNNQFLKLCGIQLHHDQDGTIYAQAEVTPQIQNPYGIVHGGLLFTMADMATGVTACQFGLSPVTLDSDFHFLRNVTSGIITARAEVVRAGRTIIVLRAKVTSDSGLLLAEGSFTYYYTGQEPVLK